MGQFIEVAGHLVEHIPAGLEDAQLMACERPANKPHMGSQFLKGLALTFIF